MDAFEQVTSGRTFMDGGLQSGKRWEIPYASRDIPKMYEDYMSAAAMTGAQPRINIDITEADRKILRDKNEAMQLADLHKRFFETMRPFDDPIRFMILRKIWPEPFDAIIKALEKRSEVQKDTYKTMLGNPTKESLILMMALADSGEAQEIIKEAVGPKDQIDPKVREWDATGTRSEQFQRGLFSRNRLTELANLFDMSHRFHPDGVYPTTAPSQPRDFGFGQGTRLAGYTKPSGMPAVAAPPDRLPQPATAYPWFDLIFGRK
jgi:hypothetical protein